MDIYSLAQHKAIGESAFPTPFSFGGNIQISRQNFNIRFIE